MIKREKTKESQPALQGKATEEASSRNDARRPTHVGHELFNQNELLKDILKDCIEEGM